MRVSHLRTAFKLSLVLCLCFAFAHSQSRRSPKVWRFAVSGDSRNCGDVVMPAIAKKVRGDGALFYWHLGDFRWISNVDEDFKQVNPKSDIPNYEADAWPDFIQQQLTPFGDLPVYLALGNHETIPPKTRIDAIQQFADWFDAPEIKSQRLRDDPNDHLLKTYYHWIKNGVDFITLDNSTHDQFDDAQQQWFKAELERVSKNPEIRTVVVGMHKAFPDSVSTGHSMNESVQGTSSGRAAYKELVDWRTQTHKNVYVLASHSHMHLEDVYNTVCRQQHPETILPGWIAGTAGAVRYRLPAGVTQSPTAETDTYGYLLGEVAKDGTISFQFKPVEEKDVPAETVSRYSKEFVGSCLTGNHSTYQPAGPPQPPNCP